jgi:hypothetical protein
MWISDVGFVFALVLEWERGGCPGNWGEIGRERSGKRFRGVPGPSKLTQILTADMTRGLKFDTVLG